jgi:hypothetical protein
MRLTISSCTGWLAIGLVAQATAVVVLAQEQMAPDGQCQWVSELTPEAVIRFEPRPKAWSSRGMFFYRGEAMLPFRESQSSTIGSIHWHTDNDEGPSGEVVLFHGDQVLRGSTAYWTGDDSKEADRVLLVGFGRMLMSRSDRNWRDDKLLLAAGEGFWRLGPGCRSLI